MASWGCQGTVRLRRLRLCCGSGVRVTDAGVPAGPTAGGHMRRFERIAGGSIVAATVAIVLGSLALVAWTQSGLRDEFGSIRRSHDVVDALNRLDFTLRDTE